MDLSRRPTLLEPEIFARQAPRRLTSVPPRVFAAEPADVLHLPFGYELEGFRVETPIAVGGFGAVYRGTDLGSGQKVALKLRRDWAECPADAWNEATAWSRIVHPNIVRLLETRATSLGAMLVLELVEGESLHQRLHKRGTLGWRETVELGLQLLSGLEAAWAAGVVHRDVTPRNVLLTEAGGHTTAKLTDLGLATFQGESLTRRVGTVGYAAPEQLIGHGTQKVDRRADLFGLGATLYRAAAGVVPFRGHDWGSFAAAVQDGRLATARVFLPEELRRLLWGLLVAAPEQRTSASRFREEAELILFRPTRPRSVPVGAGALPDGAVAQPAEARRIALCSPESTS